MVVVRFPPVSRADPRGLLAIGGDLEVDSLVLAYRSGIFPWPYDEETLTWYAPPSRAVLFLDELHIQQRLLRIVRSGRFECVMNRDFHEVIRRCSELENRGDQDGTWLTNEMIEAYCRLHDEGIAHSFEAYEAGALVGGLYGVRLGQYFSAESSFYRVSNASKVAMCFMIDFLQSEGLSWFDCQVLSPFSKGFGAREIPRREYMKLLGKALDQSSSKR